MQRNGGPDRSGRSLGPQAGQLQVLVSLGALRRRTLNLALLRLQSSQELAGGPRSQRTVQGPAVDGFVLGTPLRRQPRPVFQPQTVTGQPQGTDPPRPSRQYLCTHSPCVHTLTPSHSRELACTPARLPACAHSPCQVRRCDGLCPPCRVVRLKLLPTPPGQLALCLSLPIRTGSGPPGTGQLPSELHCQQ